MRIYLIITILLAVLVSCSDSDGTGDNITCGEGYITVAGNAYCFPDYSTIEGAVISIVESPGSDATTDIDGRFKFSCLKSGSEATFVMKHPDYPLIQTKTFILPENDIDHVTFQAPDDFMYDYLVSIIDFTPDDETCQIVTTVTEPGGTIYVPGAHGEPDATASLVPAVSSDHGPIYFNNNVIPDRSLMETSIDGGVVFINVPPGDYTIEAY